MNTKAHCNKCGGERNHEVLHAEKTSWPKDQDCLSGRDEYETLKCMGCDNIKLRHVFWFSKEEDPIISYYPPAIFRPKPNWLSAFLSELPSDDNFIGRLLVEIYVAIQNNLSILAAMGVRSLIENVMISKVGDQGTFAKIIAEFENRGYVSKIQRENLEAIIDAGHAATHRSFSPTIADVVTLVDIAEHIIETVYLHEAKIKDLKKCVPPKKAKL